jgi:hypothetical protein
MDFRIVENHNAKYNRISIDMGKSALVTDIFAFERQHGMHISLGKKHNVYKIGAIKAKQTRFHIDVKTITILDDNTELYGDGK